MHITIDSAEGRLRIGPHHDAGAVRVFSSESSVRSFVMRHFCDPFQMSRLRAALAAQAPDLTHWTDAEVKSAAVSRLWSGAWRVRREQAGAAAAAAAASGSQTRPAGLGTALQGGGEAPRAASSGRSRPSSSSPSSRAPSQSAALAAQPAESEFSEFAADQIAQAEGLERAAEQGTPFCEICEAKRKEREAMEAAQHA